MLKVIRGNKHLLERFFDEMMKMSEGSYNDHLILIEEEIDNLVIKTVPILDSQKAIKHYIADLLQE